MSVRHLFTMGYLEGIVYSKDGATGGAERYRMLVILRSTKLLYYR